MVAGNFLGEQSALAACVIDIRDIGQAAAPSVSPIERANVQWNRSSSTTAAIARGAFWLLPAPSTTMTMPRVFGGDRDTTGAGIVAQPHKSSSNSKRYRPWQSAAVMAPPGVGDPESCPIVCKQPGGTAGIWMAMPRFSQPAAIRPVKSSPAFAHWLGSDTALTLTDVFPFPSALPGACHAETVVVFHCPGHFLTVCHPRLAGLGWPELITYRVKFPELAKNLAEVEAIVPTGGKAAVEMMMPIWTPGYYKVENYAANVQRLTARTADGQVLKVEQPKKNRWTVQANGAKFVVLSYALTCKRSFVTSNYVGDDLMVLNGGPSFITVEKAKRRTIFCWSYRPSGSCR